MPCCSGQSSFQHQLLHTVCSVTHLSSPNRRHPLNDSFQRNIPSHRTAPTFYHPLPQDVCRCRPQVPLRGRRSLSSFLVQQCCRCPSAMTCHMRSLKWLHGLLRRGCMHGQYGPGDTIKKLCYISAFLSRWSLVGVLGYLEFSF